MLTSSFACNAWVRQMIAELGLQNYDWKRSYVDIDAVVTTAVDRPLVTPLPPCCVDLERSFECMRSYQTDAVKAVICTDGRVRNGVIVMPCGSGKTLVGCALCALVVERGQRCVVLTTTALNQWMETFARHFPHLRVWDSTSDARALNFDVCLGTYNSIINKNRRENRIMSVLGGSLLLCDEVHAVGAKKYNAAVGQVRCSVRVGLTATPIREDDQYELAVKSMFGETLFKPCRKTLVAEGFLARIEIVNVIVPFPKDRLGTGNMASVLNPFKIAAMDALLSDACNKKIIVYCDDVQALHRVHAHIVQTVGALRGVGGPLTMQTSLSDRIAQLRTFTTQTGPQAMTMSRVGDESYDIPDADTAILLWNGWGSRRQLVQRIGRVSRPGHVGRVFVLLSDEEAELRRAQHRDDFLKAEGFSIATERGPTLLPHAAWDRAGAQVERIRAFMDEQGAKKRKRSPD